MQSSIIIESWQATLERDGYAWLPEVLTGSQVAAVRDSWHRHRERAQRDSQSHNGSLLQRDSGELYGARNLLRDWPEGIALTLQPQLVQAVREILGPQAGLVRGLFFDKPPGSSWALPWHQDRTIAVQSNAEPPPGFSKPTHKAGIPHLEAPQPVLSQMLTARIHLDAMAGDNGPLQVIPGSHCSSASEFLHAGPMRELACAEGAVLLMRPLLGHASRNALPETTRHRRIVHLEFAASPTQIAPLAWADWRELAG
ncbi:phytanoyl-CoA dioxygenase family protein [Tuwongella immobilis]|uniref:Phytanoyl-CoA dioxygenase n=1 Tax=Tuwongella immobilis TaxID=692036 RepID=A0A6C2YUN8_9BACT|nr:phytanoyl-CoA dioxygenase family protein [Tuwongella immobilis]VIP05448.1 Phytanoyl-CoA dioxygenase OS=Planctomyces brasiliensis (strain ATCC 49424 / DSM 5305 / JCM 21570 / NBRC 103401 / IFAM 1448) GN=Plabr_2654 PE=4 SV=1: PhyH [Tuwongella immobilis]VTS08252.1 Phytanoyl-CoA dioxygenase OS=Planctomyces brasiliensis (strain ATCC 49424 / DSM 5305 / JCM 21570 / NBRC 103401 / IFAM 1448) GN=Plabr_2654 PE=4 SV=1: PhyH [Tuwongella immobilis]